MCAYPLAPPLPSATATVVVLTPTSVRAVTSRWCRGHTPPPRAERRRTPVAGTADPWMSASWQVPPTGATIEA